MPEANPRAGEQPPVKKAMGCVVSMWTLCRRSKKTSSLSQIVGRKSQPVGGEKSISKQKVGKTEARESCGIRCWW